MYVPNYVCTGWLTQPAVIIKKKKKHIPKDPLTHSPFEQSQQYHCCPILAKFSVNDGWIFFNALQILAVYFEYSSIVSD